MSVSLYYCSSCTLYWPEGYCHNCDSSVPKPFKRGPIEFTRKSELNAGENAKLSLTAEKNALQNENNALLTEIQTLKQAKTRLEKENEILRDDTRTLQREKDTISHDLRCATDKIVYFRAQAAKTSRICSSPTIKVSVSSVVVGQEPAAYFLPTEQLAKVSDYFSALLNFQGKETTERHIMLSELSDHPVAFQYFVEFLFTEQYEVIPDHTRIACVVHAMVYILADRLVSTGLKSLAMTKLIDCLNIKEASGNRPQSGFAESVAKQVRPSDATVLNLIAVVYGGTYSGRPVASVKSEEEQVGEYRSVLQDIEVGDSEAHREGKGSDDGNKDESNDGKPDPIRTLVARYAASRLDSLKKHPRFRKLAREFPDFAEDTLVEASSGSFCG